MRTSDRASIGAMALLSLTALAGGCAPERAPEPESGAPASETPASPASPGRGAVDHVIVAIDTLERGIELLREATGVAPAFGGAHPGRGTQNALLSLGEGTYLELLAPNPADSAGPAQVAAFAGYRDLTPTGWAARTDDADSLAALLGTRGLAAGAALPGSRKRPDGTTLSWSTFAPWDDPDEWLLPFFIEWDASGAHPASTAPEGCTLVALTLSSPSADSVRLLLQLAGIEVPVEEAAGRSITVTLECPKGRVSLAGAPPM